ncbi:MAG: ABC transporter permease [Actinomycetota bacterium]
MSSRPSSFTEGAADIAAVEGPTVTLWFDVRRKLKRDRRFWIAAVLIAIFVGMAIAPQAFFTESLDPVHCNLSNSALTPSREHWFGTDILGCDYYTRVVYGARTSIEVGFIVGTLIVVIALSLGSASGYFGGKTDMVISRFADIWFSVPTTLGAILALSLFHGGGTLAIALVLVFFGWPDMTRLVRSTVIGGKHRGYVRAAKTMGSPSRTIMRRHVLPNGIAPVLVFAAYTIGGAVGGEAGLTFLGVGLRLPAISWGLQISIAQTRFTSDPYLLFFPSLFLSFLIGGFVLLGESLRDALDVKLIEHA